MNAGAYGKEIKDIILCTKFMDNNGNIGKLELNEHKFEYRKSIFKEKNYIILESTFKLKKGKKSEIEQKIKEYQTLRQAKQPISFPSAGSTFKRGEDYITSKLIDECGLKGKRIGGAMVSEKHAGFIINYENATSKDIIELTELVKKTIFEKTGKKIELEIEIIGENA